MIGEVKDIEGIKELIKTLDLLGADVRGEIMEKALWQAAEPIEAVAQALTPRHTGTLARNIKRKRTGKRRSMGAAVQVVAGDGWYKGVTFYGAFIEMGHFVGSRKRGGNRAYIPARPFMRPAFDSMKGASIVIARNIIGSEIERRARRYAGSI